MDRQPNSLTTLARPGIEHWAAVVKGKQTTAAPTQPPKFSNVDCTVHL